MRRPSIIRPVPLTTAFPEDIRAKLDLYLWSESEQRVPKGAYQKFLVERIRAFFTPGDPTFSPSDISEAEGEVPIEGTSISKRDGKVLVMFPTRRQGLSMTPLSALQFASALIKASQEIKDA